jgi:transposase
VLNSAFYEHTFNRESGGRGLSEIRLQLQYKAAMRNGRIVLANRSYPSTQICWCCGCLTGPKGREELHIGRWVCVECGAGHTRDSNAAINLRRLGLAKPEVTCGDTAPLPACASILASAVDEPQTSTVLAIEHIIGSRRSWITASSQA